MHESQTPQLDSRRRQRVPDRCTYVAGDGTCIALLCLVQLHRLTRRDSEHCEPPSTLCRPPTCRLPMQQTILPSRAPQHSASQHQSAAPRLLVQRPACPRTPRAWGRCCAAAAAGAAEKLASSDLQQWEACVDKVRYRCSTATPCMSARLGAWLMKPAD